MESKAVTDMVVAGGVITAPVWMSGATVWMQFIGAMIGLSLLIWRVWKAYKEQ